MAFCGAGVEEKEVGGTISKDRGSLVAGRGVRGTGGREGDDEARKRWREGKESKTYDSAALFCV